jgi:uncharacterized RDD family membrane protein YckC
MDQPTVNENITQPVQAPDSEKHYRYGGFLTRYIATFIDGVLVFLVVSAVGFLLATLTSKGDSHSPLYIIANILQVLLYVVSPVYTIYFLHKHGATPGKKAMHLQVVSVTHEPLSIGRLVLRELVGKMISGFFGSLGYFWYLFDEKRQAWHDKIAHTIVIDTREISEEAYQEWKAKQKSELPTFLILAAVTPLFFMMLVFGMTQIPMFQQYVLHYFPLAQTFITVLLVILGINVVAELLTGVWLLKEQRYSRFLVGTPTKIGIGVYMFFQIFVTIGTIVGFIAAGIMFVSQFPQIQSKLSQQNTDKITQQYTPLKISPTPSSAPAQPDFLTTMKTLEPIVPGKSWEPIFRDTLFDNPYTSPITGYTRKYTLPQSNKDTTTLLDNYRAIITAALPKEYKENDRFDASGVGGSAGGFTIITGNQARIIHYFYQADWVRFSPNNDHICPCGGYFEIFYSDPFDKKILLTSHSATH